MMIKKKRFQLVSLCFSCALLVIFTLAAEKAEALCPIDPDGTYIEAEHFTDSFNFNPNPDPNEEFRLASRPETVANGGYVLRSRGGGSATATPENEMKMYTVEFTEIGTYYIWMRGKGGSSGGTPYDGSMFFRVDADPWKAWDVPAGPFRWISDVVIGGDNTITIATTGAHVIQVAMREPYTLIDGFYITRGSETPIDDVVPSDVTSINPNDDCSASPAHWTANPNTLGPTNFEGYNAASMSFTITNDGTGDDTAPATVTSDQNWAVVSNPDVPILAQGESHTVTVNFNTTGLTTTGSDTTYFAALTVTGAAYNSPLTIPVTLLVKEVPSTSACGEIPLYAENLVNPAIMVQLDTSGSMSTQMSIGTGTQSRINIAEDVLAEVFLDRSIAWGFATWAGGSCSTGDSDQAPTYYTQYRVGINDHDATHQTALQDHVDDGSASGCTPLAPTMRAGLNYFQGVRDDLYYVEPYNSLSCQPRIAVIVTDGYGNTATDNTRIDAVVDDLIAEGVSIVAVGFGLTDATQLDRIVQRMQTAGEEFDEDYLYSLHYVQECDSDGNNCGEVKEACDDTHTGQCVAVPFMAQNRQEFIDAMNNIVSSVKAQVFFGSSPAPTTSVDNGEIVLTASFDASDWSGNLTATEFDALTGQLGATHLWEARDQMPATAAINGFISDNAGTVTAYDTDSIAGDNFLCKPFGDIINSTPSIVGSPPFFYPFDSYFDYKYMDFDSSVAGNDARESVAYVGANDGALHAFRLSDGVELWRFYPYSVTAKMALAGTSPQDDMCSPSYCHQFLLDGSPEPADIYVAGTGWRTILTTGLGEGGSAFFALDVTYGEDFAATTTNASSFRWEFTETDDAELGLATSWPSIARVLDVDTTGPGTGWATYFGSGRAVNELQQNNKEAYLFAVNSWDKGTVWVDAAATPAPTYRVKLVTGTLLNDEPAPPLVIDTQNDDYQADRIYLGNLYGDMYRVHNIGFGETPVSELLFDSAMTDHSTPVTAKAGYAYAGDNNNDGISDIWLYFGTGKYRDQVDKFTVDQQYFYGLFDEGAAEATPYIQAGLVEITTGIVEAFALDEQGNPVDLDGDGTAGDPDDLRSFRTLSCPSPVNGQCNPNNLSWALKLAIPTGSASERTISQPLIVGGIVFFTTFVPDGDVCEGNGDTWLFAVDWQSGEFVSNEVFDINESGAFDARDRTVQDTGGSEHGVAGIYIGTGKPSGELAIHNDILFVGTTGQPPTPIRVNLPEQRVRLRSWQQVFN